MRTAASLKSQSAKAANRGPKHFRNSSAAAASGASVLRESLKRTITDFDIVNALAEPNVIDVSEVVEQQKLSRFLIGLVVVSWIITFFDGFDSNLISFAAPYFATAYHLSRLLLGNIFSAGLLGTVFGGAVSLACAFVLYMILPESIRFLASKGQQPARIAAIVRRIAPQRTVPANALFIVGDEGQQKKDFKPALLFKGELRLITPLIWTAYIASSMAVFFIVNWTPLVFEALKFSRNEAVTAASVNSIMGAVGGLILMRFTDKRGAIAITV